MGSLVASLLIVVAVAAVGYFVWWVFARLYFVRATADRAFVRTGGGSRRSSSEAVRSSYLGGTTSLGCL